MKGSDRIVQLLNEVLVTELTAINQYFLGAKMCRHRGYARLHEKLHKESVEEMKHAERLVERILFLEGLPNLQKLDKIQVGESVPEQMKADLALERKSVEQLNGGIAVAREVGDNGTADLLEDLLEPAESHVEWLETQLGLIAHLGEAQYLAQHLRE
jgi:bacterioferritin